MFANLISVVIACAAVIVTGPACAGTAERQAQPEHKLGDHPAVVIKRMEKKAGYDYVSKFYPHPAWLYLSPSQPGSVDSSVATNSAQPATAGATAATSMITLANGGHAK